MTDVVTTCRLFKIVFPAVNMLRKINNMKQQSNKQSQSHLVTLLSQVFVLYFIFVLISSILFNFLLQLLFSDRNPQSYHPLSLLFLIPDVDYFFIILGDISLSLICQKHVGLTISLSVHVTIQFKWLRNIHGYIHSVA